MESKYEIKIGDALSELKKLESESVDCSISSPPYWNLRDYQTKGQLGLEEKPEEFISKLCDIYDEVKRVLKKSGTVFVNISDTYSGNKKGKTDAKISEYVKESQTALIKRAPIQEKSLVGIPEMFVIEMQKRGWIRRNTIVWWKRNAMPSSVKDRFNVDFEYIYFFTKHQKYFFNQQFEGYAPSSDVRYRQALRANKSYNLKKPYQKNTPYFGNYKRGTGSVVSCGNDSDGLVVGGRTEGRNMRTVWDIPTVPSTEPHFAMYPEKLVERLVESGCPPKGLILDSFSGMATTGMVASKLGRKYIGIEISEKYARRSIERLDSITPPMF